MLMLHLRDVWTDVQESLFVLSPGLLLIGAVRVVVRLQPPPPPLMW